MPETTKIKATEEVASQPVLVATDFSPDSEAALLWAGRYASQIDAPLVVLHVVHDPAEAAGFYRRKAGESDKTMTQVAEEMMASFLEKMKQANPGLAALEDASTELVEGLPSGRIVETAKRDEARIVVVGSRGLTGLSSILIGSVAERVAQLAPMPVVIVKRQTGD